METNQPQINQAYKEPIATNFLLGDLRVDVFGEFSIDGYEPELISLTGTRIDITSVVSDDHFSSLQERLNSNLPSWAEVEDCHRQEMRADMLNSRRELLAA